MSTLDRTKDLIIDRDPPFEGSGPDIPMTIAQILISCSLCIGVPLNFVPVRTAVFEQIFEDPGYTLPRYDFSVLIMYRGLVSSIIFTVSTCFFTIYLPGISVVLGIVGGFGCVAISYIIPIIAFLTTHPECPKKGQIYILIASVLVGIGFGAAINSIIQIFSKPAN